MNAPPLTLLTGFLGAGKTTLLKNLFVHAAAIRPKAQRLGVLINERGQVGIEQPIEGPTALIELGDDCACCVASEDLVSGLDVLLGQTELDRVILETSGSADPLPIVWRLENIAHRVRLDAVVTVIDTVAAPLVALTEEWQSQLRIADVVVVSKTDVATPSQQQTVLALIKQQNAHARIIDSHHPDLAQLLLGFFSRTSSVVASDHSTSPHAHHSDFVHVDVHNRSIYCLAALEDVLDKLPPVIFRAKGIVHGENGQWVGFQVVAQRVQLELDARAPLHGESRLTFFGRDLSRDLVEQLMAHCAASS